MSRAIGTTGAAARSDATAGPERRVRVYAGLRTAHLERFPAMVPARVLYTSRRADFDRSLVDPDHPPERRGRLGVLRELAGRRHDVVEVNEPALVERWPDLLAQVAAVRLQGLVTRRRPAVVAYAIGNADPALEAAARWRLPAPVARAVTAAVYRLLVRGTDRLAFGTAGAYEAYARYVPERHLAARSRLFEALPSPCDCPDAERDPTRVAFVGSLVPRKGVAETLAAWDALRARRPDATFHVVGHGRLEDAVAAWAAARPEVTFEVDPPRARVHEVLRRSAVLVLLSQPHGHWREQIGLPILEGLSHGCEIVTTSETGIAGWLAAHGHAVLPPDAPAEAVADRIDEALRRARTRRGSLSDLPVTDQRIAADRWLMTGADA
ncbi:MAG TPA: glycosyltransferase [Acidimicrobiales bacterium]